MRRHLLFYRDFQRYSGGHGKVRDYFDHAEAHPAWSSSVYLAEGSRRELNPWLDRPARIERHWTPARADALVLGGMDWLAYPGDDPRLPVINLVQGLRHGDPSDPRHAFLTRPAVRICVSTPVADALHASGRVRGPVRVIEAALSLPTLPQVPATRCGVLVDAVKQPDLGRSLQTRLKDAGWKVDLVDTRIPRVTYLHCLARAEVAVLLPGPSEGFYLPGLEAMALGCPAVVPDSGGNRAYLDPGINALVPPMQVDALEAAVHRLRDAALRASLAAAGQRTARRFGLDREREAFHHVLDDLDALWHEALSA